MPKGLRTDNPADRNINDALAKLSTKEHQRALPFNEVGTALATIRETDAWPATKLALELVILTATRSGQVRLAEWSEVDMDSQTWTIPASRMKSEREHRIPLSARAMEILTEARDLEDGSDLIFASPKGKPLSDSTMSKLLRENGVNAVPHGFRSSFRDWCAEENIDRQIAESALAHNVGDATETAYLRSDMFKLRKSAMDGWANYIAGGLVP